ncbi:MAG TPA: 3'(2'),5'-bisphosphate nucleotidase [Lacipirellulaceae bacterium]|nr:3'(2'),5'-bisphosphate nucleotidase [Lacipirellulaceae bacterium]
MFDSSEARFAIEAVREASLLAQRIQREMVVGALTKKDRSPVTVADFAVQALIARRLAECLPGSTLIGEEQADALRLEEGVATLDQITEFARTAIPDATPEEICGLIDRASCEPTKAFWSLDPIDGTKGFLRREQYAVALALIRDGIVKFGVLGCPELKNIALGTMDGGKDSDGGWIVAAACGGGTWAQSLSGGGGWQRLRVSTRSYANEVRILRSVEKSHTNVDEIGQLGARLGTTESPLAMDSQAKYAVLAAGAGDVLLRLISPSSPDYRERIWDQAAGSIVVEEAGGRITDLDGQQLDFSHGRTLAKNRGILATNGLVHETVLKTLRAIGA